MVRGRQALSTEAITAFSDQPDDDARRRDQAASIARYKRMYDRSSELAKIGVWEFDLVAERMTWTDGVYDLFELPRGAPLTRAQALEYYSDRSRREMERMRADIIANGGSFVVDIQIRTAKGNDRWLRLTADAERENGRSVRIFGTKQDITETRTAEAKVQSLQTELIHVSRKSAMGAMAATFAHELNQPLAAICNYVAGTRRALGAGEDQNAMLASGLDAIERSAFRASNIIRSLRAMTSGSAGKRETVDPNPMIHEAATLALAAGHDQVRLSFALADKVLVSVDSVQIQQVLINLIKNAAEAVQDSAVREVAISSKIVGRSVEIRVEDSGAGISPAMAEALFETFASSKPGGMGVGLSISRTIVEAHGGKVVAANGETGGACFCVTLPLATPPEAVPGPGDRA